MIVSVASGKGGTGKTTVSTNLAYCMADATFVDCDVEEPNAHIFLKPHFERRLPICAKTPRVLELLCNYCGECSRFCRSNALAVLKDTILIFPELCHHCGGCALVCPQNAIIEQDSIIGYVEEGTSGEIRFIHGISEVGVRESIPIIQKEKELLSNGDACIIDAAAGTSCMMVEAVRGSDYCILVTEPTPFGLNDLTLAVQVVEELHIPFGVVINRADVGDLKLKRYCVKKNIPVLLEIPFERSIAERYSKGFLIAEKIPKFKHIFEKLYHRIQNSI